MRGVVKLAPVVEVISAVMALGLVTACTTIPGASKPEAISSYAPQPDLDNVPTPQKDQPSDLLLRDFISASAHPVNGHGAARAFLTDNAARNWQDNTPIVVLERTDMASDGASDGDSISYQVRGSMVGRLGDDGAYTPELSDFEADYRLRKVDGQWRISELPNAVVIERADFISQYTMRKVFFMERGGEALVPDLRWVYNGTNSLPNALMSMLAAGPGEDLRRGVRTLLPSGVNVRINKSPDGGYIVDLLGVQDLSNQSWQMLAAQIVWTLASSDLRGPYQILADGTNPYSEHAQGWQIQHVAQFDPSIEVAEPLRAVAGGAVFEEQDGQSRGLEAWTANRWVESLAISGQETVLAAVTGEGDAPRSLLVGQAQQTPQTALRAKSITKPSWSSNSTDFYAVADGNQAYHFTRDLVTGAVTNQKITMDSLKGLGIEDPRISVFRVSRSGARALMVINGRVYVAVLETSGDGRGMSLGRPLEIGHALGDTAVSADWRSDGTILVGTRANEAPLWQLTLDGSEVTQVSARNLTAPVVAVASEANTIYATDSRALMQLNSAEPNARFWREVPSMQGQRAVPVLAF